MLKVNKLLKDQGKTENEGSGAKAAKLFPHTDGINLAFADGYAKWFKYNNSIFTNDGAAYWWNEHWVIR